MKIQDFCHKIDTNNKNKINEKKKRKHRFDELQQLPTFSRQKEREILFKSINSGYNQWRQYPSLYR